MLPHTLFRTSLALFLAILQVGATPEPSAGQVERPDGPGGLAVLRPLESGSALERADSLFAAGAVLESLDLVEARLGAAPSDFEARWRAARGALVLGILASGTEVENAWFRRAVAHAERAVDLRPRNTRGLYLAASSKGRLALQTGARETADLAQEVWELAHRVLKLEPDHAGAHNVLGKLHQEVMSLSVFRRFLARTFLGGEALDQASWEAALGHHERAVELEPTSILYRVDLAETLVRRDREAEALEHLRLAAGLPLATPADRDFRAVARSRLRELTGETVDSANPR